MSRRPVLLGIFPHPDDESYAAGGTLAKASAAGAGVYVLCATRGGAGQNRTGEPAGGETLGDVREQELAAACAALGVHPPRVLDYPDGTLSTVDLPEAVGRVVQVIRELRPDVVVTLGADGVYGHPDHIALHKIVTPAFRSAGGGSRFPESEFGPPHQPARLFWTAFPRGLFRPFWEELRTSDLAGAIRQVDPERLGTDERDIDAVVDVRDVAAQKLAAIASHRSQLPGGDPLRLFPPGIVAATLAEERFTLGFGEPAAGRLTSLFEGLAL